MSSVKDLVKSTRRIFVTADTHFGHTEAIAQFKRPFASVDAMDEAMIANMNAVVGANDILIHLGDFTGPRDWNGAECKRVAALRDRIACRHLHLVRGNHDPSNEKRFDELFESVSDVISARGISGVDERIVMFHYPIDQWQGRPNGGFHLHGHVHAFGSTVARRCDVGVDVPAHALAPQPLVELIAQLRDTPPSGFVRA